MLSAQSSATDAAMSKLELACSFCLGRAEYGPIAGINACDRCARLIAIIARRGDRAIWMEGHAAGTASSASLDADTATLKAKIAKQISEADEESHANLADAYLAMGLFEEAVREAATALKVARRSAVIASTLQMLLSPPLLRSDGFVRLRRRVPGG